MPTTSRFLLLISGVSAANIAIIAINYFVLFVPMLGASFYPLWFLVMFLFACLGTISGITGLISAIPARHRLGRITWLSLLAMNAVAAVSLLILRFLLSNFKIDE